MRATLHPGEICKGENPINVEMILECSTGGDFPTMQAGQILVFTTNSRLYPDTYQTQIRAVFPDRLELLIPLHQGYLLLLPAGTEIRWLTPGLENQISTVLSRQPNNFQTTLPHIPCVSHRTQVIAVGSGKGGVGKTTFSINLGIALSQLGQHVVLLDADLGMANIDILLGIESSLNLGHVISGECSLSDILQTGPGGVRVLPGSSGISALTRLDPIQFNRLTSGFRDLEKDCDTLILDTGAGISELVLMFLSVADELILLSNPEPHAIMDAYALMKALTQQNPRLKPNIVMNRCDSEREARQNIRTLKEAAKHFLGLDPTVLGWLPNDPRVTRSLKERFPLLLSHPQVEFSRRLLDMGKMLIDRSEKAVVSEQYAGIFSFWERIRGRLGKRPV